jgi:hypothetical protein
MTKVYNIAGDEWESAKIRQLEMDRRVVSATPSLVLTYITNSCKPPELLSRILLHLEDFAKDAWPGVSDEAEPDWQRKWNSGLDVDGL